MITILGVDPGYAQLGLAVVELGRSWRHVQWLETFKTSTDETPHVRLNKIARRMTDAVNEAKPNVVAFEEQGFVMVGKQGSGMNAGARRVLEVAGIIRGVGFALGCAVIAVAPSTIKKAVTGNGRASKAQVSRAVRQLVGPNRRFSSHAADAVAIAITSGVRFVVAGVPFALQRKLSQ